MNGCYSVGVVSRVTGVTHTQLFHWSEDGFITAAKKVGGKYKRYTVREVLMIEAVMVLRRAGFSYQRLAKLGLGRVLARLLDRWTGLVSEVKLLVDVRGRAVNFMLLHGDFLVSNGTPPVVIEAWDLIKRLQLCSLEGSGANAGANV